MRLVENLFYEPQLLSLAPSHTSRPSLADGRVKNDPVVVFGEPLLREPEPALLAGTHGPYVLLAAGVEGRCARLAKRVTHTR